MWGSFCSMMAADDPEQFDCAKCVESGKRNQSRGRTCLFADDLRSPRDLTQNPILYEYRPRGEAPVGGAIRSEAGLIEALELALKSYRTDRMDVALMRTGRGLCPKSFPLSPQSHYFLSLYRATHGGESGVQLLNLPLSGGVLDQPNIFFSASTYITHAITVWREYKREREDKVHRHSDRQQPGDERPRSLAESRARETGAKSPTS